MKKLGYIVLTLVLASTILLSPTVVLAAEVDKQAATVSFLRDAVGLDVTQYEITHINSFSAADDMTTELYNLKAETSTLEVSCNFKNNIMVGCIINPLSGSPLLAQPATDEISAIKTFIPRYQNYSKATYLQPLQNILDTVDELTATTKITDDIQLTIDPREDGSVSVEFMRSANGIKNIYDRVILVFRNGVLQTFSDNFGRYPIGTAELKISQDQAIEIAKEHVKDFSYGLGNLTVTNLNIVEEEATAEVSMQSRNNELFPLWQIYLPLDKLYPGNTFAVQVALWADNGEVISIKETSALGDLSTETPNASTSSNVTSEQNNVVLTLILAVIVLALITTTIVLKKRK